MKRVIAILLTAGAAYSIALSQMPNKKPDRLSRSEQQVRELNQAWADAITKSDAAALDRIFADDMIVTSGSGAVRNKAEEIKDAAGGGSDPDFSWTRPFTTEDLNVKVYNEAAWATGLAKWGFRYKSQDINQERRYTHVYIRNRGKWRIVAQHISSNLYKKQSTTP